MLVWMDRLTRCYSFIVLERPRATLLASLLVVAAFAIHVPGFRLDASSDSLVLENDEALRFYQETRDRYGSDDYLIVTYSPLAGLFSDPSLADLRDLRDELRTLPRVASVTSILDVPLLQSPPVGLGDLQEGLPSLEDPSTDRDLAEKELRSSPLYADLLLSEDARTAALLVAFVLDETYQTLQRERDALRAKRRSGAASEAEVARLGVVGAEFDAYKTISQDQTGEDIAAVRTILESHRGAAEVHLGGVPMIVADSIAFIRSDLVVFGTGVIAFLVVILAFAFRTVRWILLPLSTCAAVAVVMMGLLGWVGWPVTVVSSNFLSVLLIITLSLTIHLIVAYQELHEAAPDAGQQELVRGMVGAKARPCAYTALTTAVAFGSLLVSGIRPVIDFGWMMVVGVGVAFVLAFTLFPAASLLLPPPKRRRAPWVLRRVTSALVRGIRSNGTPVFGAYLGLTIFCAIGLTFLTVDNRFIDYFRSSTEIYSGMLRIDQELGGTTPLDVVIDAPAAVLEEIEEDELDDEFFDDWEADGGIAASSHWFRSTRMDELATIHRYLDERPETGKVLSLHTSLSMLEQVEPGLTDDDVALSILYKKLPSEIRETLVAPYFHEAADQVRFSVRVFESDPSLDRPALLEGIRLTLTGDLGIANERVHLTGMVVLYNNLLQSLFRTQILTVGVVFGMIGLMFLIAFRNLRLAAIAVVPNLFAGGSILGLMGVLGIPLDLMTITIAAISIGIGVDDTIHYVHRLQRESAGDAGDLWMAVERSHASVGRAMIYTTLTIALGFSILVLSNFVPTAYFGALIGLAMVTALVADLTLLPLMIVRFGFAPNS
jgi:hypothetical protein